MNEIYQFFKDLVRNLKPIMKLIPQNNIAINILSQYYPLTFEANVIISDINEEFYFRISPESCIILKKRNPIADMSLVANKEIFMNIIEGKTSLLREFNFDRIYISNLKQVYMYRIILLGILIQSKEKYDQRYRILQLLPIKFVRHFLEIILIKRVSSFMLLIIKRISNLIVKILLK
ncbi:MAG: hypothetical protein ACTSPY_13235 [Candidatus Helarchaeota archaeon]